MSPVLNQVPVIAIDGPSASGKGTVAQLVANQLGFNYLDSGALYRIVALAALKNNIAWSDQMALVHLVNTLYIQFKNNQIFLNDVDVTELVRNENVGRGASEVAVHPLVRGELLDLQHSFRKQPGLVADGRDMATVVFTDADLKVFLYGSDWLVEEHLLVPDVANVAGPAQWVVGTALNMRRGQTVVSVFKACAIGEGPVAQASLPYALPLGLHGCFVPSPG